jgi:hypothetical protein
LLLVGLLLAAKAAVPVVGDAMLVLLMCPLGGDLRA